METDEMVHGVGELEGAVQPQVFIGLDELLRRLIAISVRTRNSVVNNDLNLAISELFLLQKGLERLKSDRCLVDAADVDGFIDRLIHG